MIRYRYFVFIFLFIFASDVLYANKGRKKAPARRGSERTLNPSERLQASTPSSPTASARPAIDVSARPREGVNSEMARYLLDRKANLNSEMARYLLDRKAYPSLINIVLIKLLDTIDDVEAVRIKLLDTIDDAEAVRMLIEQGANVNARDDLERTSLHLVENADIAEILLEHGADVHARDYLSRTPLHITRNADVARVLIRRGAEVEARLISLPSSYLIVDARRRYDNIGRGNSGDTPLHTVVDPGVAKVLLERGAVVDTPNDFGWTPLYVAKNAGVAEVLLVHGADVHFEESNKHWTPLYMASVMNRPDVVRVLIEHGAVVNARDAQGRTPLDEAYLERTLDYMVETIHVLIVSGARRSGIRGMQDGFMNWVRPLFNRNVVSEMQ